MKRVLSLLMVITLLTFGVSVNFAKTSDVYADIIGSTVNKIYLNGDKIHIEWEGNDSKYYYLLENDVTHQKITEGETSKNYVEFNAIGGDKEYRAYFYVTPVNTSDYFEHGDHVTFIIKKKGEIEDVNVFPSKITIKVGEQYQLKADIVPEDSPDKELNWYSKDDSKVTVTSDGLITGISAINKVKVYAEAKNGERDYCSIEVVSPEPQVEDIIFDQSTYIIKVGETLKIVPTILPDNAVNKELLWETRSNSINVDSSGNVTGICIDDSSRITVKSTNGISKNINVQVIANPDIKSEVTEIDIVGSSKTLEIGEKYQLQYGIEPYERQEDAEIEWKSSNASIVSVDSSGLIEAIKPGIAEIIVTTENDISDFITINVEDYKVSIDDINSTYEAGDIIQLNWSSNAPKFNIEFKNDTLGSVINSDVISSNNFKLYISEVEKDTTYSFKVTALNEDGKETDSDRVRFTVKGKNYEVLIDDINSTYEAGDTIQLNWSSNAPKFKIEFKNGTLGNVINSDVISSNNFKLYISEVEKDTDYLFKVTAIDENGKETYSDTVRFAVKGKNYEVSIDDINSTYEAGDIILLNWSSNAPKFKIEFKNDTLGSVINSDVISSNNFKLYISEVEKDTDYLFKVTAIDENGKETYSDTVRFAVKGK